MRAIPGSFRFFMLVFCALTVGMLATPPEAAAQRGHRGRGSVHSAGRRGGGGPGRRGPTRHTRHVHHVHHAMHPWALRGPSIRVWHPIGFLVTTLAVTAIVVSIADDDGNSSSSTDTSIGSVYYDQGVYYEKTADGQYKAIPPPEGAQIASLPEGYTSVSASGKDYGYYQGDFYVEGADGTYVVTAAPVGAIVPYLPDAAEEHEGDGTTTYTYSGVTYQPVSLEGDTSYVVSSSG
jgi:hypothetical protein